MCFHCNIGGTSNYIKTNICQHNGVSFEINIFLIYNIFDHPERTNL